MNILHVLSQFEITGAEAYVASLVKELSKRGHRSFVVSDTLCLSMDAAFISHPIGRRSYLQRIKNIFWLRRFIRENKIQLVHAHSRAASWVSFAAARLTKTAYVSTIHGRQHLHPSSRLLKIYGDHLIAVCECIKEHLSKDLHLKPEKISVIPNGLDWQLWEAPPVHISKEKVFNVPRHVQVVAFIGRLSGLKGDVVRFLLSKNALPLQDGGRRIFTVIGSREIPEDLADEIESTNRRIGSEVVVWKPSQSDIAPYISAADVVIGSGRVALEALALRKSLVAFGESEYLGIVSPQNFHSALKSNFGDAGKTRHTKEGLFPDVDPEKVLEDVREILVKGGHEEDSANLSNLVRQYCNSSCVAEQVQKVYESAYLQENSPSHIPVLMYHRVVDKCPEGLSHGIWVTTRQLDRQLSSLRARDIRPITFKDYDAFARGEATLPARPIILTFDDGYEDNYTKAFPILQKYGFRAVVFVVTSTQNRTNFWDADQPTAQLLNRVQMQEMSGYGIEFGSHTNSHADLTTTNEENIRQEVTASKLTLEEILERKVTSFAYPHGRLNDAVKRAVAEAGYTFAVAADSGPLVFSEDPLEIRRTQVFPWTSQFGFWKKTQPWYWRYKNFLH